MAVHYAEHDVEEPPCNIALHDEETGDDHRCNIKGGRTAGFHECSCGKTWGAPVAADE
jgi:hypothetical protein